MTTEKISIIVPIYHVEAYLSRCIDSLLAQTYENLEIILVDDGSPDSCGCICDQYANKDMRIRVIHKENGGLSDARNAGMKIATGDLIAFVDSDDWVHPDFTLLMYQTMMEKQADIVECAVLRTDGSVPDGLQTDTGTVFVYNCFEAMKLLIMDKIFHQHVWNKLYRREVLEGIEFPVGKYNEDEFWTYQVFGRASSVAKIEAVLYYYFQRSGSIMGTQFSVKRLDGIEAKILRQRYIEREFPKLKDIAGTNLFGSILYAYQMVFSYAPKIERKNCLTKLKKFAKLTMDNRKFLIKTNGTQGIWYTMAVISLPMTAKLRNLLNVGL